MAGDLVMRTVARKDAGDTVDFSAAGERNFRAAGGEIDVVGDDMGVGGLRRDDIGPAPEARRKLAMDSGISLVGVMLKKRLTGDMPMSGT